MFARRGQSILEYTIMVGIIAVMLSYMGTGIKRGVQSLVKVTADQVGNQENADQDYTDDQQGYMVASNSATQEARSKQVTETGYIPQGGNAGNSVYVTNLYVNERTDTQSNTITNGGFAQSN